MDTFDFIMIGILIILGLGVITFALFSVYYGFYNIPYEEQLDNFCVSKGYESGSSNEIIVGDIKDSDSLYCFKKEFTRDKGTTYVKYYFTSEEVFGG